MNTQPQNTGAAPKEDYLDKGNASPSSSSPLLLASANLFGTRTLLTDYKQG